MPSERHFLQCFSSAGLHRISYKQWGAADNPAVLVCVHGLTRVADDFDAVAEQLSDRYRVICPDIVGRGQSGWLANPALYQIPQYLSDMVALVARLNVATLDWLGTSMGGLIGMAYASIPNSPIKKLILNDVGPSLDPEALQRIGAYVGQDVRFNTFDEAAAYIKSISLPFGPHTDTQWDKLARDVLCPNQDGKWVRHYDLGLARNIVSTTPEAAQAGQAAMWAAFDAIKSKTLVIRGLQSDLLSQQTAQQMTKRGPRAQLIELAGVGHAPTLVSPDQIAIVRDFLLEN